MSFSFSQSNTSDIVRRDTNINHGTDRGLDARAATTTAYPSTTINHSSGCKGGASSDRVTVRIAVLFAIGCIVIIGAFTAVTAYSAFTFSSTITKGVKDNLELSLRAAMQLVTTPIDASNAYIDALRDKIETNPDMYALDDANPTSLVNTPSIHTFFIDAMLTALHRKEMAYIFQVRKSSRYTRSPSGAPIDMVAVASRYTNQILFLANDSFTTVEVPDNSVLSNITGQPESSFSYDTSGDPYVTATFATAGKQWVTSAFVNPDPTVPVSVLMSIYAEIRGFSGGGFGIGIDHNMIAFQEFMLQATVPFSIGTPDPQKVVSLGAHTTLYDLSANVLITSSMTTVKLFSDTNELWPAGNSPNADLNAAYAEAIAVCGGIDNTFCQNDPSIRSSGELLISALRNRDLTTKLDHLLVSVVPRSYFFATTDTTLGVSIGIGVFCCVLIVAGCILLLRSITPALHALQENMLLASELQNHRVVHRESRLTDIANLSAVFDQMNQRLLSFVPEAVLLGHGSTSEGGVGGGEDDESEGGDDGMVYDGNTKSTRRTTNSSTLMSSIHDAHTELTDASGASTEKIVKLFTMNEKRISVLSVNLVGFHALVSSSNGQNNSSNPRKIHDISTKLLSIVVGAAHLDRGVLDSFHGDHFMLTFNASRAVAGALAAAVRAANLIVDEVRADARFRGCLGIACGAAVGRAHIGTLGIEGHRRLSVVGGVYSSAIRMQHVSGQFIQRVSNMTNTTRRGGVVGDQPVASGCAIEESALKDVGNCGMYMQLIGRGAFPNDHHHYYNCTKTYTAAQQPQQPQQPHHQQQHSGVGKYVYLAHYNPRDDRIGNTQAAGDAEWLYELNAIEAGDPYRAPNEALMALMNGDRDQCGRLIPIRSPPQLLNGSVTENTNHNINITNTGNHHVLRRTPRAHSRGGGVVEAVMPFSRSTSTSTIDDAINSSTSGGGGGDTYRRQSGMGSNTCGGAVEGDATSFTLIPTMMPVQNRTTSCWHMVENIYEANGRLVENNGVVGDGGENATYNNTASGCELWTFAV